MEFLSQFETISTFEKWKKSIGVINTHHHHQDWFSSAVLNTTRVDCLLPSILSKVSSVWGLPVFITNTTMEKVELCGNWHPQIVETEKES
jgi:hypothetical protein